MRRVAILLFTACSLVWSANALADDQALYLKGKHLYEQSCAGCHGADGKGDIGRPLAGQEMPELIRKMKAYKAGRHVGFNASLMTLRAKSLSDEQIRAVALYISRDLKI